VKEAHVLIVAKTLGILLIAVVGLATVIGAVFFQVAFAIYVALFLTAVGLIGMIFLCFAKLEVEDETTPH